jgi:haloacetate dehalogenase
MWIESTLPLETGFVRIPSGLRLRFRRMGDGPVILLLHGWPQTGHAWRRVIPTLATSGYTVVAPDLRGAGESDKPTGGYDAVTRMEDVRALLAALELNGETLFVVGHGDGGAEVAAAFADVSPAEVTGLALLSVLPGFSEAVTPDWHVGFHQTPDLPETLIGPHLDTYLRHFLRAWAHDPGVFTEADVQVYVEALTAPGTLRASLAPFRAGPSALGQDGSTPRLFLVGESDPRFTPDQLSQAQTSDAALQVIQRAGHWLPEERPDAVATALLTFFEHLRTSP